MAARVELQGVKLKKSGQNKFAGYSYFELGDFLPEIQQIFFEVGLCGVVSYDIEYARLCITDVEDGTTIVITSPMAEANLKGTHPIQNLGAVETYQRRYLWMTAMEIVEHDVLDASEPVKEQPKPAPAPEVKAPPKPVKPRQEPKHVEPEAWTIMIDAPDDATWVDLLLEMTKIKIGMATSEDDLKAMFQVNKALYGKLKTLNPAVYVDIMDSFAAVKRSFNKE
jgi:hypothetical protein